MELRSRFGLWTKTTLTLGSEFLMDQISVWWIWTTMQQRFLKISSKNMRYNWMRKILLPIKGKSETTKKRTCWLFTKNRSHGEKELDRYWTRETFSLRVRGFEESDSSSSSFTESSSRRRWSGSLLENKAKSSKSIPTIYSLVWRSMESMLGSRRRSKKEIPVLYWWFRNNCLFPSSSRTFRTQSYWSFIARQCCDSEQILPIYLPYWMCVQSAFYHQLWINTWRSKFEQETDNILPACWSWGQKSQGSWRDWLECTTSCTIPAKCMEETSKRGDSERIESLSDSIEGNHPSRNTSSLLYSKSC